MKSTPTLVGDQIKIDAYKFLNCQVKAQKLMRKHFNSLPVRSAAEMDKNPTQLFGLKEMCDLIELPYKREDWQGNAHTNVNWDIVYIDYKGYRFFELVDKE